MDVENPDAPGKSLAGGVTDTSRRRDAFSQEFLDETRISGEGDDTEVEALLTKQAKAPCRLRPQHGLVADRNVLQWSVFALRWALFCDSVSTTILQPNFPFIALPGSHADSFPNTEPFDFSGATYFLPMTALLGAAITSTFVGNLSDRIGRKPCVLACVGVSVVGTIAKYFARETFWGFCAANFVNGLFGATLPVAMAYVSDIHPGDQKAKDSEIGILVGAYMLGASGGGIVAILMESSGLFMPLWIGAALNFTATIMVYFFLVEPSKLLHQGLIKDARTDDDEENDDELAPERINIRILGNIVVGSVADNVGSTGLYPLTLSPLAFNAFYVSFLPGTPIMSEVAFKWLQVMVALLVIPGAAFSQVIFARIGPAGGCVLGNFFTAILTIGCLYIALIEPASNGSFAGFIVLLYSGYPFTVISQLSTGPMLDRIAPAERRGFVQGINTTVMNSANALAPWLLGILADEVGTEACIWTCVGISFLASILNTPLIFEPLLKVVKALPPDYSRALNYEDQEVVERALAGEWIPAEKMEQVNFSRMQKGKPFLVIPYRPYEEDKPNLSKMKKQSDEDFKYLSNRFKKALVEEFNSPDKVHELVDQVKASQPPPEQLVELKDGLGHWFADYLEDNGYTIGDSPILYKQMIMKAFPPLGKGRAEFTEENFEQITLNYVALLNKYLEEPELSPALRAFSKRF